MCTRAGAQIDTSKLRTCHARIAVLAGLHAQRMREGKLDIRSHDVQSVRACQMSFLARKESMSTKLFMLDPQGVYESINDLRRVSNAPRSS